MAYDNFGGESEPPPRVPLPSPLRWVIAAGVTLILVAAAFVGGWITHRYAPKTTSTTAAGLPVAPAPADPADWKYPAAEERGKSFAGGTAVGDQRVGPLHTVQLATADSFEKVLGYYAQVFAQPELVSPTTSGGGGGTRWTAGGQEVFNYSHTNTHRGGVRGKLITYRTSTYDLVIHVTRAEGEKHTHVLISYMPHP